MQQGITEKQNAQTIQQAQDILRIEVQLNKGKT